MKTRRLCLISLTLLVVACGVWVWSAMRKAPNPPPAAPESRLVSTLIGLTPGSAVEPPPRTSDPEELQRWWQTMRQRDRRFEWKMPIEFYGLVIDDQGQPVEGAKIRFQWTDLSPEGTSESTMFSNNSGLFQLSGAKGKNLGVEVRKEGYKHYFTGTQFSFEYAAYSEKSFHVPDRNNPVIFRLRKNRKTEPLIKREVTLPIAIGSPATFAMDPKNPDAPKVVFELLTNAQIRDKQWSARISVPGGGLQATLEEFPFEAPESGYETSVFSDYNTPKPVALGGSYEGGVFFVHNSKGYGRVEILTIPGKKVAWLTSFWNPSGSRNLE
jgi:hypothetical protein